MRKLIVDVVAYERNDATKEKKVKVCIDLESVVSCGDFPEGLSVWFVNGKNLIIRNFPFEEFVEKWEGNKHV